MRRASFVAVLIGLLGCGANQVPPEPPTTNPDLSRAEAAQLEGRFEESVAIAKRILPGLKPASEDANRARFLLDFRVAALPPLPTVDGGPFAMLSDERRLLREEKSPAQATRRVERMLVLAQSAQLSPVLQGHAHFETANAAQWIHHPQAEQEFDRAAAAYRHAKAVGWEIFVEVARLENASGVDHKVASQPRTAFRAAELARRAHDAGVTFAEAVARNVEGQALMAQGSTDLAGDSFGSARLLFTKVGRYELAAEACGSELISELSLRRDLTKPRASAHDCIEITKLVEDPLWRSQRQLKVAFAITGSLGMIRSTRANLKVLPETVKTSVEAERKLALEVTDMLHSVVDLSIQRKERDTEIEARALMTRALSTVERDDDAIDALAPVVGEMEGRPTLPQQLVDALAAYAVSSERTGRTSEAINHYRALSQRLCAATDDRGVVFAERAAALLTKAAGLADPPGLPKVGAGAAKHNLLTEAADALNDALHCGSASTFRSRILYRRITVEVAEGAEAAAAATALEYVKAWDRAGELRHDRTLPSPLELLPQLVDAMPSMSLTLRGELLRRTERLAARSAPRKSAEKVDDGDD